MRTDVLGFGVLRGRRVTERLARVQDLDPATDDGKAGNERRGGVSSAGRPMARCGGKSAAECDVGGGDGATYRGPGTGGPIRWRPNRWCADSRTRSSIPDC